MNDEGEHFSYIHTYCHQYVSCPIEHGLVSEISISMRLIMHIRMQKWC